MPRPWPRQPTRARQRRGLLLINGGISVIEAPSILGLRPSGVERLPAALKAQGLMEGLGARAAGVVVPPPYNPRRDPETNVLNPEGILDFSGQLADRVERERLGGAFPLVLGGDCSILIGCLLALRRRGTFGLFFIDGHADFYQPEASQSGEVADMDLAIVSGRGPTLLTDIEGLRPLVEDENVVAFGYRDADEQRRFGSQDIEATAIQTMALGNLRGIGLHVAVNSTIPIVTGGTEGFWIHVDADVLDDAVMPAVDYRLPGGGLGFDELSETLSLLLATNQARGMSLAIFNPALDDDGSIARALVQSIVDGFRGRPGQL